MARRHVMRPGNRQPWPDYSWGSWSLPRILPYTYTRTITLTPFATSSLKVQSILSLSRTLAYVRILNDRFIELWFGRQAPQSIRCMPWLIINYIQHFHFGEAWFLPFHKLWDIDIATQELLFLNLKLSLRTQIQLITINHSLTSYICHLLLNGTNLEFLLCSHCGLVTILSPV